MPATLASKTVALLAAKDLKGWRDGMIEAGHNRSSVARTCRALKAALNLVADHDQRITNRAAWRIGLGNLPDTEEARNVILSNEQVLEVVRACHTHDPALGLLIEVLAATGARLSQVKRLRVEDVLDAPPRLNMPSAKKGRKKRIDRFPVPITGALHAKLRSNRPPSATLLRRVDGREWAPLAQRQQFTRAIKGTDTPTITAYALRHSSIVRQLLANVPIRIVAAGHDTSVTMIERNYAKYIQSHADDLVRATLL
jgi:integrase